MKFFVKKSKIHGKGLFTCNSINAGKTLGTFKWRDCNSKKEREGNYGLNLGNDKIIFMTCDFKYINHSDKPNVCLYDDLTIMALTDIKSGEEIVSNYGEDAPK